ncbi:MAG TPA: XRE family transcriptional regulator [Xanthobacteraceae bacterium]|nr:XRE family transcriptional regulator [Xanthobacteraceae bacterium]
MEDNTDGSADRLASRLRELRVAKNLSLQELAARSGVSRATLSRIENGEVSPTAETLGALASAYAMTISRILAPAERPFQALIARAEQSIWQDRSHGFTRHIVSPPSGALSVEIIRCELAANQSIAYEKASVAGLEHHLIMLKGALSVTVEGEIHSLKEGDCLRYRLFGATRFETRRSAASYLIVLA